MNWEFTTLVIVGIVGYFHLLNTTKQRYVSAVVRLYIESQEKIDEDIPLKVTQFDKQCRFIITPTPGMGFLAADIGGSEIKRVIIDELGGLEVICHLVVTDSENEYAQTCEHLASKGWQKKHYV